MLVELARSSIFEELRKVEPAVVRLFDAIANAGPEATPDEVLQEARWPPGSGKPPAKDLSAVLRLGQMARTVLSRTVVHDLTFVDNAHNADFVLNSPHLDETETAAAFALLQSLYTGVLSGTLGFVADGGTVKVTRSTLEDDFRFANPELRVCPACLIQVLEPPIDGRSAVDMDHYFPKSVYPTLAVHAANLVPVCSACNRTAKRERDPLALPGEQPGRLVDLWLPYVRAGLAELDAQIDILANADGRVRFRESEPQRRHDYVFSLRGRWSQWVMSSLDSVRGRLIVSERRTLAAARRDLETYAEECELDRFRVPQAYVKELCIRSLLANGPALEAMLEEVKDALNPTLRT